MKVLAGVVLAVVVTAALHAQIATFKSRVDLVSFSVTAVDKKGDFVERLKESDFEVYEDGKKQTLTYFTAGTGVKGDAAAADVHLGVLFDISGSMDEDLTMSRSAAIRFLKTLSEDAKDMTLVDFDTEIRLAQYAPTDFASLVERIRSRKTEGGDTALYDALGVCLHGASLQDGRKILVLYTDGGENASEISYSDMLNLLKASDVTVYAIGFMQHAGSSTLSLRSRLEDMAALTGGQAFFPLTMKDLDGVYEKIRDEIRAQYVVGYQSSNARQDGTWRKVEIRLVGPELKKVKLRARKGYFAPYGK